MPLVNVPLEVNVELAVPEPQKVCETKQIELTEVVCSDVVEEKCIDLAKLDEGTVSVEQVRGTRSHTISTAKSDSKSHFTVILVFILAAVVVTCYSSLSCYNSP